MDEIRKYIRQVLSESFLIQEKRNRYQEAIDSIKHSHLPKEIKEKALKLVQTGTKVKKGIVTGLKMHPDLSKKIKEKDLPNGFSMGMDKNGYFVHTHRARCKSSEEPGKLPIKSIRFIDSTGE